MSTTLLLPNGFGYGSGTLSYKARLTPTSPHPLTLEEKETALNIILSGLCFVPIEAGDDGCGDGRFTVEIFRYDPIMGKEVSFRRSLARAKIFGGGLTVATSMYRTLRGISSTATLLSDRQLVAGLLDESRIAYGAHTDSHAHGSNCGCGAIDRYDSISRNIVAFAPQIIKTTKLLMGDGFSHIQPALDQAVGFYRQLPEHYFAGADGSTAMELIKKHGAVIKQLGGEHLEVFVVVNTVPGTTFDAALFAEELKARGIATPIQVFVVDAWRGEAYIEFMATYATKTAKGGRKSLEQLARADFLARTLATAATLTAGDLPVLLNK